MKVLILSTVVLLSGYCQAQANTEIIRGPINTSAGVLQSFYIPEHVPTKKVIPYAHVREADVAWSKRIWRTIDLREKFNHSLYYPLDEIEGGIWKTNSNAWSLWTIIRAHVMSGDLTLYSPYHPDWEQWKDGDGFKYPVTSTVAGGNYYNDAAYQERINNYLGYVQLEAFPTPLTSTVNFPDDSVICRDMTNREIVSDSRMGDPNIECEVQYPDPDTIWYTSKDIIQYRIKEDWFFDKQRSSQQVRIIGIAPVIYSRDKNGNITGTEELFWLYFPECRYVLQNFWVQNKHNTAQKMSFDDLFWKRKFQSYIIKESNLAGRGVGDYCQGVDALLESERIKEKLFLIEHDLWNH